MLDGSLIQDQGEGDTYKEVDSSANVKTVGETELLKIVRRDKTFISFCDRDEECEGRKSSGSVSCCTPVGQMSLSISRTVETDGSGQRKSYLREWREIEHVSTATVQQIRCMSPHWGIGNVTELDPSEALDSLDGIIDNTTFSDDSGSGSEEDSEESVIINDAPVSPTGSISIVTSDDDGVYIDISGNTSLSDDEICDLVPVDDNSPSRVKIKSSASSGVYMEVYREHSSYRVRPHTFSYENANAFYFTAYQRNCVDVVTNRTDEMISFSIQLGGRTFFLHPTSPHVSGEQRVLALGLSAVSRDKVITEDNITRFGEKFFFCLHGTSTNTLALESLIYPQYYISFESDRVVLRKMSSLMKTAYIEMH